MSIKHSTSGFKVHITYTQMQETLQQARQNSAFGQLELFRIFSPEQCQLSIL